MKKINLKKLCELVGRLGYSSYIKV